MPRLKPIEKSPGFDFRKVMAHREEIAQGWDKLDELIRFSGVLEPRLKEEARRAVAQETGCLFCSSLGTPKDSYEDPRVAAAVAFATAVGKNPKGVDEETWAKVAAIFNEAELVELCTWIAFMYAGEMFGALMRLNAATPKEKDQYSNWLETGYKKIGRAKQSA